MKNVDIKMKFGNSKGFIKRHGVTTVLEIIKHNKDRSLGDEKHG